MTGEDLRPVRVTVEAPARLHFGVLDLRGHRGRSFGGIGAAVPTPSVRLEATPGDRLTAEAAGIFLEVTRGGDRSAVRKRRKMARSSSPSG